MLLLPTPILILFPPDIWYISLLTHFCHPLCYFCCFPLMNMDLSHLGHFRLSKLWIEVSGPEVWNFLGILLPSFLSQILGLPEWLIPKPIICSFTFFYSLSLLLSLLGILFEFCSFHWKGYWSSLHCYLFVLFFFCKKRVLCTFRASSVREAPKSEQWCLRAKIFPLDWSPLLTSKH